MRCHVPQLSQLAQDIDRASFRRGERGGRFGERPELQRSGSVLPSLGASRRRARRLLTLTLTEMYVILYMS
jgi:hypothetical protein